MKYYCDNKRHLVCIPYSIENLHLMAKDLKISKSWYHAGKKPHYDIPKTRIEEIQAKCTIISDREIVHIIKSEIVLQAKTYILKSEELENYKFKVKLTTNIASSKFCHNDCLEGYTDYSDWLPDSSWRILDIVDGYFIISPFHIESKLPKYFKYMPSIEYIKKYHI